MNPRVLQIPGSMIRNVAAKKRPSSIDLGLGEPSLPPNPEHFAYAMAAIAKNGIKYTPNAGDHELREAIARYYHYPDMHRAANVCVTAGSQEAMYVALKTLLDPAQDELLIVEPAFPAYTKMAALEGVGVRCVAMQEERDFAFDADRIAAAIGEHTRAIVLCSPCNPTARVFGQEQAQRLVHALERRKGRPVWVIHDEIYREQTFVENAAYFAEIYPHTIVTNSLSKSNALTGLRLGWILAPHEFIEQAVKTHAWVTSCADTFAQYVARHVFMQLEGVREHAPWYREQCAGVAAALHASGLRFVAPEGSFYAAVRLPSGVSSLDAATTLIEEHDVLAIPGSAFGAVFESWLRLSWVSPLERIREGVARIAAYYATLPSRA
ncbi:MAG TPA: pyridoxal phosphate-dependent aminotransferase [Verrucomicrobiae bacterium]|nr:pyridoxal phosphate-dependent aminotransferase [Verrucomicrobiae bacterium]